MDLSHTNKRDTHAPIFVISLPDFPSFESSCIFNVCPVGSSSDTHSHGSIIVSGENDRSSPLAECCLHQAGVDDPLQLLDSIDADKEQFFVAPDESSQRNDRIITWREVDGKMGRNLPNTLEGIPRSALAILTLSERDSQKHR